MMCTCRPCYLLFTDSTAHLRYRSVPDRYLSFPDFELGPGQWDELEIPVGLAFFFRNSELDRTVAFYPGPAGATESELPLDAWGAVLARNPALAPGGPDTEALLIRGPGPGRLQADCHLVPMDACYELVGRLRRVWRGFDGGQEARDQLAAFFDGSAAAASPAPAEVREPSRAARSDRPVVRRRRRPPEPYAAAPQLTARLRLTEATGAAVHAIALRCQVRILPQRRGYAPRRRPGCWTSSATADRWPTTLKSFLWMQCSTMVQGFTGQHRGGPAAALHLRLRRCRRQVPARPAGRRDPAGVAVLRNGLHQGPDGLRRGAGALGPRGAATGCRWRSGAS